MYLTACMAWFNYNQFYYFWMIAREGGVTRAAARVRVSQSNLSEQLKQLEEALGHALFERRGRTLVLTEAGRKALAYANTIFESGQEMLQEFEGRAPLRNQRVLRIGAISSLSKNLQFEFIRPLLLDETIRLVMVEGDLPELVRELQNHQLDLVISNSPVRVDGGPDVFNHRLAEIPVSLVGTKKHLALAKGFPKSLEGHPLYMPDRKSRYRAEFEALLERKKVVPDIRAEVEDMALLRLFALSGAGVALVPEVVVQRELQTGKLSVINRIKGYSEVFYAVTITRKFPNPQLQKIVREFMHPAPRG